MMRTISTLVFFLAALVGYAQSLYVRTFGDPAYKAVIFLHGGPGGTSIDFELTTAESLAQKGFFVIAYDRRGEGRSSDEGAQYTFEQTFHDLNMLYQQYKIKTATLIGHSFGGIVGTLFANRYPEKTTRLILLGAPVSLPQTFKAILESVSAQAVSRQDSALLKQVETVRAYDKQSIYYSSGSFMLAMQHGLYNTKTPADKAKELYALFMNSDMLKKYSASLAENKYKSMLNSSMGFWKNENYTTLDITHELKSVKNKGVLVQGMYGMEDGLFDATQIQSIRSIVGDENFWFLENCSHGVFIDQQELFLHLLVNGK